MLSIPELACPPRVLSVPSAWHVLLRPTCVCLFCSKTPVVPSEGLFASLSCQLSREEQQPRELDGVWTSADCAEGFLHGACAAWH